MDKATEHAIADASEEKLRASLRALKTPGVIRDKAMIARIEAELRHRRTWDEHTAKRARKLAPKPKRRKTVPRKRT
jgi:hypothetical protein